MVSTAIVSGVTKRTRPATRPAATPTCPGAK